MSGASVGCSRPRPCSGRKPLRRCRNSTGKENVVLIDVDSGSLDNVIIIDVPESLSNKFRGSSVLRRERKWSCPQESVICLDDEENNDGNAPNNGVKNGSKFHNGASSSMRPCSSSRTFGKSSDAVGDVPQFIPEENATPVKLSKGKRTYSAKTSARKQYGLSAESESSSDSDYPDCELMEDFCGTFREQWERASSKRKYDVRNGKSDVRDPDMVFGAASPNGHVPDMCSQPKDTTSVGKDNRQKEAPAPFTPKENGNLGCARVSENGTSDEADDHLFRSTLKRRFCADEYESFFFRGSQPQEPRFKYPEYHIAQNSKQSGSSFFQEKKKGPEGPSSFPCDEPGPGQVNNTKKDFQCREKNGGPWEPCLSKPQSCSEQHFCGEANLSEGEPSMAKSRCSESTFFYHGRSNSGYRGKISSETSSSFNLHVPSSLSHINCHGEKMAFQQASSSKTRLSDKHVVGKGFTPDKDGHVPGETLFHKSSVSGVENHDKKDSSVLSSERVHKSASVSGGYVSEVRPHSCSVNADEEPVNSMHKCEQEHVRNNTVCDQDDDAVLNTDGCIISEREKLKETDEYKKAIEEEWASRQQVLQVQAEEAQQLRRLRKRRKAESLRLLDMERRQKQRVEEMRETQKKDEENMNLKEVVRAEVRKELSKLEVTCNDMASVLRGLGILAEGGLHPSLNEVRSAYKRALLTFHPDRASRSDIRQQVEAEEKFKLISRMKEKFLPF